jgi:hypothetical protein
MSPVEIAIEKASPLATTAGLTSVAVVGEVTSAIVLGTPLITICTPFISAVNWLPETQVTDRPPPFTFRVPTLFAWMFWTKSPSSVRTI